MGLHSDVYSSPRWQRLRQRVLGRDRGLCVKCKRKGRIKSGVEVDHIEAIEECPAKTWDIRNLQTLCRSCHSAKTAGEVYHRRRDDISHDYKCRHGYPKGLRGSNGKLICCK